MTYEQLWAFFPIGLLFSIVVETPVLLVGLSARHSWGTRLFAGVWLTACTYPIVVLVLPLLLQPHWFYLLVAETFAPVAECWLFWMAFIRDRPPDRRATLRDMITITLANLASFGGGELLYWLDWWPRWAGMQGQ
jgi:hypothetical protein